MKFTQLLCCGMLYGLLCSACMTAEPSEPPPQASESRIVAPSELSLEQRPQDVCGGPLKQPCFESGACAIRVTCHNPNTGCRPSYCRNGGCGGDAATLAAGVCASNCPNADCSVSNMVASCNDNITGGIDTCPVP